MDLAYIHFGLKVITNANGVGKLLKNGLMYGKHLII